MRAAVIVLLAGSALAQPAFEAASVKAASPAAKYQNWEFSPGGVVKFENVRLSRIIQVAYGGLDWQMEGPRWLDDARYDIMARAAGNPKEAEMLAMLRALLEDRFE